MYANEIYLPEIQKDVALTAFKTVDFLQKLRDMEIESERNNHKTSA
jgi:hypothetical protein